MQKELFKPKSLVTGGAGFIGSNLVDKLLELGHEVIVIDNEYSDAHEHFYWNQKAQNHKLDIRDYERTRKLYDNIDYVFHIAAESRIQPAINNPVEAVSINSVGTATVLQCSREANVKRVIYSSTSSAYGRNPIPNIEDQPDDCLNPYAVSKVSGEKLCSMYTDLFELNTIIFRYFNVYGERQPTKGQYAPVLGLFLKQTKNNEPLTIVGDGEQRRDFTHVSDVVMANVLAATAEDIDQEAFGKVYNIGNGVNYSVNQIADLISSSQTNIPPRLGESRETLADNSKFKSVFNWEPKVSLVEWVKDAMIICTPEL
jgi:UDP-glucose 4-epimerase